MKTAYKKINVELIVFSEDADAVIAELNSAIDRMEETAHDLWRRDRDCGCGAQWGAEEIGAEAYACGGRDGGGRGEEGECDCGEHA